MKNKLKKPIIAISNHLVAYRVLTLLFCLIYVSVIIPALAQESKVTLKLKDKPLSEVLDQIEVKTGYSFLVRSNDVNLKEIVSIDVVNKSVVEVLTQLFKQSQINYEIKGKSISIFKPQKSQPNLKVTNEIRKISGLITDTKGDPIIGANVSIKGQNTGTITDVNGKFQILVEPNSILKFSYIGYQTQELTVGQSATLSIVMTENNKALDEIVVIGYGVKKKRDVIGSVATIKADELNRSSSLSAISNLQGKASGLNIVAGKVMVRGVHSIHSSSDPLWVVDGITSDPPNSEEIESIEVLKDASATAIYGSRGSNGVIIVTTKRGKEGKTDLNFSVSTGLSTPNRDFTDMGFADNKRWFQIMDQATANSGVAEFDPMVVLNMDQRYLTTSITKEEARAVTDKWFDIVTQNPGSYLNASLSLSTGSKNGTTYLNANYRKSNNILPANDDEYVNVRSNSDYRIGELLTLGLKLYYGRNNGMNNGGSNIHRQPWKPLYNVDDPDRTGLWNPHGNPLANFDTKYKQNRQEYVRVLGGLYAELKLPFLKGLAFRTEYNQSYFVANTTDWQSPIVRPVITDLAGSYALESSTTGLKNNLNGYFKYSNSFGLNSFSGVLGAEGERSKGYYREASGQNMVSSYPQLGTAQGVKLSTIGYIQGEDYLMSYFGRADYKYADKYLVGVSLRTDGSSIFDPEYRWGVFTAYSAGWIITEEKFMKPITWINMLKLRGSLGQTGNKNIPSYKNLTAYKTSSNFAYGEYATTQEGGSKPLTIGNKRLTWETTSSYDIGLDYGILDNRINGSIAYYLQDVSGLILAASVPQSTGLTGNNEVWGNMGRMSNSGFELNISSSNIRKGKFEWNTDFNFSTSQNKVVNLTDELDSKGLPIYHDQNKVVGLVSKKGGMVKEFYMPEYAGVDPEKGVDMIYELDYDHFKETGETVKTGRLIPATDGNLQNNRFVMSGKSISPTYYGGLTNTFKYGQFDLNFLITYSGGNYIYDHEMALMSSPQKGTWDMYADLLDKSWKKPGDIAEYPRLVYGGSQPYGWDPNVANPDSPTGKGNWTTNSGSYINDNGSYSKYLYKGDFAKLKHAEFGYSLPDLVLKRIKVKNFRIYAAADNIYTLTKYPGWSPDAALAMGGVLGLSYWTFNSYLNNITLYGGIQIKF